jgi:hypothetical protein
MGHTVENGGESRRTWYNFKHQVETDSGENDLSEVVNRQNARCGKHAAASFHMMQCI